MMTDDVKANDDDNNNDNDDDNTTITKQWQTQEKHTLGLLPSRFEEPPGGIPADMSRSISCFGGCDRVKS
jgi:hypothetical protein